MTTLHLHGRVEESGEYMIQQQRERDERCGIERRTHRRYDLEHQAITLDRWNGNTRSRVTFGQIVDLSAGGAPTPPPQPTPPPDPQARAPPEPPPYPGICPFVDPAGGEPRPKREWTGWMTVARIRPL